MHRVVSRAPQLAELTRLHGPRIQTALAVLARRDRSLQPMAVAAAAIPAADWVTYENAAWVLAPFLYPPSPGLPAAQTRFSNGAYGVWYAASSRAAAQAEVGHHMARDFAAGRLPPGPHARVVLQATLSPTRGLVDLRGLAPPPDVRHPTDYTDAQGVGAACRATHQWGLLWQSVSEPSALCVGVLRPPAVIAAWVQDACAALWDPSGGAFRWT